MENNDIVDNTNKNNIFDLIINLIRDKIKQFKNDNTVSACYVCGNETNNWKALYGTDNFINFEYKITKNNEYLLKIIFIPICSEHNISDKDIINKIYKILLIKHQELTN